MIEQQTFCQWQYKSGHSCSFIFNGENFIAWTSTTTTNNQNTFSLNIYNVSQQKREISITNDENAMMLTFDSTFPSDNIEYFGKKLIYCGDGSGNLRIYEISSSSENKKPSFQLKTKLQTNLPIYGLR